MINRKSVITIWMIILITVSCRSEEVQPTLVPTIEVLTSNAGTEQQDLEQSDAEGGPAPAVEKSEAGDPSSENPGNGAVDSGSTVEESGGPENSGELNQAVPEAAAGFTAVEWQWLQLLGEDGLEVVEVTEPDKYTLEFSDDGTFIYRADCNRGSGRYSTDEDQIALDLGSVTLAACQAGSQADQYIQYLRDVTSYEFEFSLLQLNLAAAQGTMIYSQVYTAGPESVEIDITGTAWHWIEFSDPQSGPLIIDDPLSYEIALLAGDHLRVKADCNDFNGTYDIEGSALRLTVEVESSGSCGPNSHWETFLRDLNAVALYFMMEEDLFFDLIYDSGTMRFENGGAVEG